MSGKVIHWFYFFGYTWLTMFSCNHCHTVIIQWVLLLQVVNSYATSSSHPSTIALPQQQVPLQQQPLANMYPHVHVSHFPNFMPYRHIYSPVYVPPQLAMPNYSSNPAYPHPSNGNSYFLLPGGSSHATAGGMKYAASQYKPVPAGNPTAYGNYANPTGFAVNPPGSVGGASGLEDAARIKYKENSLYAPNPQVQFLLHQYLVCLLTCCLGYV